jgi:dipeptidyl aminopeptidase/acylaminoacyl peptidase
LVLAGLSAFLGSSHVHLQTLDAGAGSDIPRQTLAQARRDFHTQLAIQFRDGTPIPTPPPNLMRIVQYDSPVGSMGAYLTLDPGDNRKHAAIIWLTGGDSNTIGDCWTPDPPNNDQTARAFRDAGIVMMYPSLRGGNQNPGVEEKDLGEVDDVIAAADFLAGEPYVDPSRIYLGGHSTGGTLALLVSESTDRFRAVFSFGPVATIKSYGRRYAAPVDLTNPSEVALRSPDRWLWCIKSPTFVLEGADAPSNRKSVEFMAQLRGSSPSVHFFVVPAATHFTILSPANRLLAQKILQDDQAGVNINVTDAELANLMGQ